MRASSTRSNERRSPSTSAAIRSNAGMDRTGGVPRVDLEEQVAGRDGLVGFEWQTHDGPGHLGDDSHDIGVHVDIVGARIALGVTVLEHR